MKTKLTPSEARAEAVTIVLQILLRSRLSGEEYAHYYAEARLAGADPGLAAVSDEISWLFADQPGAEADMQNRDECSW
jgi:hypothetical protein